MSDRPVRHVLAVDLGTSGPKAALATTRGEILDHEFVENSVRLIDGGGAEQDPEQWWETTVTAVQRLLARGMVDADDIVAVCVTAQWSGTVAVDEQGHHLRDAIIWMDSRGAPYVRSVTGGAVTFAGYGLDKALRWIPVTGGIPTRSGKDSIAHILWIKNEEPEVYERTHKFLEPKDYLNMRLTGRCAASYDSMLLHWVTDNRRIDDVRYHPGLLRLVGVDGSKLPGLMRSVDVVGRLLPSAARELGLREDVQVVCGSPDVQSASVGSGAVVDYEGHVYIGTSSWLTCHVPFKKTDLAHNMASLPSAIPGRYLLTNAQETAGACLTFLRDNIFFPEDGLAVSSAAQDVYAQFDRVAEKVAPGSDSVLFLPWLYGERTPIEDATVRSALFNLSLTSTRAHVLRAVLEGVAYNSRWLLGHAERFAGRRMDTLALIGGGASSDVWCQIYADVCDRRIKQVQDPLLANLRGAVFIAAAALGCTEFGKVPELVRIRRIYEPDPANRAVYDGLFAEYLNLYRSNRRIFARLNGPRAGREG
jgi:xylulokinase